MATAVCLIATQAGAQQWGEGSGPNLVANPSFERLEEGRPAQWSAPTPVYSSSEQYARTGQRSLEYVNDDPGRYLLCSQAIDLQPDKRYELSAWVRTEGVEGEGSGATVCLEWYDADGEYLGGSYPPGYKGDTTEWAEVRGISRRIPDGAADIRVVCYVRKEMTGTAWWDDVSVRIVRERPLQCVLMRPNYRGWVTDEGPDVAEVLAEVIPDDLEVGVEQLSLELSLLPAEADRPVASQAIDAIAPGENQVSMPLPELEPGQYTLQVSLVRDDTERVLATDEHDVVRRTGPMPTVYIDQHNRLIVDGQPFFPLGMYWGGVTEEDLKTYVEAPFNCLMPYGRPNEEKMDLIDSYGLKCIYSIKDFYAGTKWAPDFIDSVEDEEPAVRETVRQYRDHPALLAWYLNDERPLSMLDRLIAHQEWVEEEDPNHPTWVVLWQVNQVRQYIRSFDAIGTDPYPIPTRPASMAGDWAETTRRQVADSRPFWMVPQVHNWDVYRETGEGRPPTYEEVRCMTWQCICEGADGIIYYSWMDLHRDETTPFEERWPDLKAVAEEVAEHIPTLLSVEPTPELEVDAPEAIHCTARTHNGQTWLFMVNDSPRPARATVRPDGRMRHVHGEGLSVSRMGRTYRFAPLEVRIEEWDG